MGGDVLPLQNVITVAKKNGDFTDPVEAMQSIVGPDVDNRYLIVIGPGVYTLIDTLVMQEYVDISGSGRNATKLIGAISTVNPNQTSALVMGANNAGIRSLSIENTGGNANSIGFYNNGSSPVMSDMSITVSGGTGNAGVSNYASSPTMSDMSITASGGVDSTGVYNSFSSSPTMFDMSIVVSDGGTNQGVYNNSSSLPRMSDMSITTSGGADNHGVRNDLSSPVMSDMSITAAGGTNVNYGISNWSSSSVTMSDMSITVSGGNTSRGVYNNVSSATMSDTSIVTSGGITNYGAFNGTQYDSYLHIRNSKISGTNFSVFAFNGLGANETYISDSILTGGVQGDPKCSFTFSSTGTDLLADCKGPP